MVILDYPSLKTSPSGSKWARNSMMAEPISRSRNVNVYMFVNSPNKFCDLAFPILAQLSRHKFLLLIVQVERTCFKFYVNDDDFFLVIIYLILITCVFDFPL